MRPARPRPRIASPATTVPLAPPLWPPAAAADARVEREFAELTPLHTSPVALRVETRGAELRAVDRDVRAVLFVLAVERAGAVAEEVTGCVACAVTTGLVRLGLVALD